MLMAVDMLTRHRLAFSPTFNGRRQARRAPADSLISDAEVFMLRCRGALAFGQGLPVADGIKKRLVRRALLGDSEEDAMTPCFCANSGRRLRASRWPAALNDTPRCFMNDAFMEHKFYFAGDHTSNAPERCIPPPPTAARLSRAYVTLYGEPAVERRAIRV